MKEEHQSLTIKKKTYLLLKERADKNFRTVPQELEYLVENYGKRS